LLHALAGSPYAAARALQQLATEDDCRELRPDEFRYALGTLGPEHLLTDLPPAIGRIVQALLTVESRLSQRELADQADISTRAIRNYRDRLETLDLIRLDETGYRLALSFQTDTERRNPVVLTVLEKNQTLLDAADSLLGTILPPNRYGDSDDPLGSVLVLATRSGTVTRASVSRSMAAHSNCTHSRRIHRGQTGSSDGGLARAAATFSRDSVASGSSFYPRPSPRLVNQRRPSIAPGVG
jgi:hypothetical protein